MVGSAVKTSIRVPPYFGNSAAGVVLTGGSGVLVGGAVVAAAGGEVVVCAFCVPHEASNTVEVIMQSRDIHTILRFIGRASCCEY
jgi:hypothetical protein